MKKTTPQKTESKAKLLSGVVVSNKMAKTIIVRVDRFIKHPRFGKFYTVSKKYKVHVPDSAAVEVGSAVTIKSSRPMSKDKSFVLA